MSEHRELVGRLYKPDLSLRIPNDDPRCLCELGTEGPVTGGTCAIAGTVCGSPVNLLLRDDCVHHGPAIALVLKSIGSQFSVGVHFPPAVRKVGQ